LSGDWAFAPTPVQVQFGDTLVNVPVPALCYGDVNASYFPAPPARLAGDPLLAVGRLDESNSDTWEWPVYLTESKSIGAMTVELLLPEGLSVEDVLVTAKSEIGSNADPGYLAYKQEGQVLRISWFGLEALLPRDGEELFRLKVRGNANAPLRLIPSSELADGFAQPYNSFRLAAPVPGSGTWQVALYPNPSSDKASIALTLPSSGTVSYSVVDALGRLVVEGRENVLSAGFKLIELESSLWATGAYSVRIQWQGPRNTEDRLLRFVKLNR
ncbi:MAG: T9SS type A sorting domain-containing protein, partial [Bacteroidota bacterium]